MTPSIQEPLISADPVDHIDPPIISPWKLITAGSVAIPMTLSFYGGIGYYVLKSFKLEISSGFDAVAPAIYGGISLSPFWYIVYLLILHQKETLSRRYERTIQPSLFCRAITGYDERLNIALMLLIVYSLSLCHSMVATTIGHAITENLPYIKYHTDLSQLILTIILGSAMCVAHGFIFCCGMFFINNHTQTEITTVSNHNQIV